MNCWKELGLKEPVHNEDDDAETALNRSLDRWGDRVYCQPAKEPVAVHVAVRTYWDSRTRRKVRYQAAVMDGWF